MTTKIKTTVEVRKGHLEAGELFLSRIESGPGEHPPFLTWQIEINGHKVTLDAADLARLRKAIEKLA